MTMTADYQSRVAAWHRDTYPTADPAILIAKLVEECGEVARAVVGEWEGRTGRGDAVSEAAQVVVVLLALIGRFYPDRNLAYEITVELERHGA